MATMLSMLMCGLGSDQFVGATEQGVREASWWGDVASVITAFGTLSIAVIAIWQDQLRSWLCGPRLYLVVPDPQGNVVTRNDGVRVWYYHLIVKNSRRRYAAKGCRVTLRRIQRCGPDGVFAEIGVPTPLQFQWAHSAFTGLAPTIMSPRTLDLCCVDDGKRTLSPVLYVYPNNFNGYVTAGDRLRYHLDIEADNFASKKPQVFEVAWDGKWDADPDKMSQHVTVVEIKATER